MANWEIILVTYDSDDNIEYVGYNTDKNAPTSSGGWYIKKFSYVDDNIVRREKTIGAWDDRASYTWG